MNLARLLRKRSRVRDAVLELQGFLGTVPGESKVSQELAGILIDSQRFDEAVAVCRGSLAVHPDEFALWNLQGEAYREAGKPAQAAGSFRRSLSLNPYQPEVSARLQSLPSGSSP